MNGATDIRAPNIKVNLLHSQATVSTSGRTAVPAGGYSQEKPFILILHEARTE